MVVKSVVAVTLASFVLSLPVGTQEKPPRPASREETPPPRTRNGERSRPEEGPRRGWGSFPLFVWLKGPEGVDPGTQLQLLKNGGLGGVNVEAQNASGPAALHELDFYVGHLAGKGDLHLRAEVFDRDVQSFLAEPEGFRPVRPVSLCDDAVKERLLETVAQGVARHRSSRPLAYSLDDEISVTSGISAMDYSFDEHTLRRMLGWLSSRYPDLETLNAAWGTHFASVIKVVPETTGAARARNAGKSLQELNFASWSDHREFMNVALAELVGELTRHVEDLHPGVPVGFLGGQAPSAFGGFDWWLLAQSGTFFEAYEHGLAPEMIHAFGRPQTRVVSTFFLEDAAEAQEQLTVDFWRRGIRGDDGAVLWASDRVIREDGTELTPVGRELARSAPGVRKLLGLARAASPAKPEVFLYVSQPSLRAAWMLDSWRDGDTWIRRTTSHENEHSLSIRTREAWGELLDELSLPWTLLDARDFLEQGGEIDAKVIVLNETMALSDQEVHELLRFVALGGLLIADAHPALFDEKLRGRDSKALEALFGVTRDTAVTLDEWTDWLSGRGARIDTVRYYGLRRGEKNLVPREEEARARALGFTRRIGDGTALFMNLDLRDYSRIADHQPGAAEDLRRAAIEVLEQSGGVSVFPHLEYDTTCRKLHLYRFGDDASGSFLLYPARTPLVDLTTTVYFDGVKNVQDQESSVQGLHRDVSLRVTAGRAKWVRYEDPRPVREEGAGENEPRSREALEAARAEKEKARAEAAEARSEKTAAKKAEKGGGKKATVKKSSGGKKKSGGSKKKKKGRK